MTAERDRAIGLVRQVCEVAGGRDFLRSLRRRALKLGLAKAIEDHDTSMIFDHLMRAFSYQGISDRISDAYVEAHGNATLDQLQELMVRKPGKCLLLLSFPNYRNCRYRKTGTKCSMPELLQECPVPIPPLRKGALNELAISLYLFLRDECRFDLVAYIDRIVAESASVVEARLQLTKKLSQIHAVSAKLANMVLADLLLSAGAERKAWKEVGLGMIAIDSLVHNFLHRIGALAAFGRGHAYGPSCHGPKGCIEVIREMSAEIDAKAFNPRNPPDFPRFVQYSIWAFCAEQELNICNGRQIDDRLPCANLSCPVRSDCARVPLKTRKTSKPRKGVGRRRVTRLPKPFKHGDLDGTCGVYAVINAVRLALEPHSRFTLDVYLDFYEDLVDEVDRLEGFGKASLHGLTTPKIVQLLRLAREVVGSNMGFDLKVGRPLVTRRRHSLSDAVEKLRAELNHPGTVVLLGLGGEHNHWTVVRRITKASILLHDSDGLRQIAISDCRMVYEPRPHVERRHIIGSGSAFIIRARAR